MSPLVFGLRRRRTRRALTLIAAAAVLLGAFATGFGIRLARFRALRESGPAWSFPARIYSSAVPFAPGTVLPLDQLRDELEIRGYGGGETPLPAPGTYAIDGPYVEVWTRGFDPFGSRTPMLPSRHVRVTIGGGRIVRVQSLDHRHETHGAPVPGLEPMLIERVYPSDHVRRTWVPLSHVPKIVRNAVIAAEDRRFRSHLGLDLRSNLRALVTDLKAGGVREGASTITQQLARGLFLGPQRTVSRKLSEIAMALGLETFLSKDEILEMYLNSVYWGRSEGVGIAGIAEASRYYFDAPVESLGVAQAALLAGLIPSPNSSSPFRNPRMARIRREAALGEMLGARVIDAATAARVRRTPLPDHPGREEPRDFPSYRDAVKEALARFPAEDVARHGWVVMTGLDPVIQDRAERGLADGLDVLEQRIGRQDEPLEGAFVAMDPADGALRAVVGGRDPRAGEFDRALHARRQCGSAIKPVVYAIALDPTRPGPRFGPASTLPDLRRSFPTPEGPWTPQNDDGEYHETVTLAKALAKSINVATANLVQALGPGRIAQEATRFGLVGLKPVASIGLGTNEVTLRDLVGAYGVFPAGGVRHEPTPITTVFDAHGRVVWHASREGVRAIPTATASEMTGLLEDVVKFGIAYPLRSTYGITRPLGGKTGTTNDYLDGWFVGFTPELVAGVWLGWDTPHTLGAPAKDTALPLWAGIMTPIFAGRPAVPFDSDQELDPVWIDSYSGGRARADCPSKLLVGFLHGQAPRKVCDRDHTAEWQSKMTERFADSLSTLGDTTGGD